MATLATARTIAGTAFDGSANISIDANNLSGTTLASGVTASSLTSVGTITTGIWNAGAVTSTGAITSTGGNVGITAPTTDALKLTIKNTVTDDTTATNKIQLLKSDNSVLFSVNNLGLLSVSGIDSTPIGATTPSTGAFTTLTSSGNSTLGTSNTALANSFGTGANAANVINTIGSTGGGTSLTTINGATTLSGASTFSAAGTALTVNNNAHITGDLTVRHILPGGATPTVAIGPGAGTVGNGATATITGSDQGFVVTVQTGTAVTKTATIFTVTFATAYAAGSTPVYVWSAANINAGNATWASSLYGAATTTTFTLSNGANGAGLLTSTNYVWTIK